jgi:hypothetical protein
MARWNALVAMAVLTTGALAAPLPARANTEDDHTRTDWSLGWDGMAYRAPSDAAQRTGGQPDRAVAEAPPGDSERIGDTPPVVPTEAASGRGGSSGAAAAK